MMGLFFVSKSLKPGKRQGLYARGLTGKYMIFG